jgi:hypothetical protein
MGKVIPTLTNVFRRMIARVLVGSGRLLYQAGFTSRTLGPVFDSQSLGDLKLSQTSNLDPWPDEPFELIPASPVRPQGAARFRIERPNPTTAGQLVRGAVVYPFPDRYEVIRLSATFELLCGALDFDSVSPNRWAAGVLARAGDTVDELAGDLRLVDHSTKANRLAVTLQCEADPDTGKRGARFNTPGGAPLGEPIGPGSGVGKHWLPDEVFEAIVPTADFAPARAENTGDPEPEPVQVSPGVFTVEMEIDRAAKVAQARLYVMAWDDQAVSVGPGYLTGYLEWRPFHHDYLTNDGRFDSVGFAVAIASGDGPAAVTVRDFQIHGLTGRDRMHDILAATWLPAAVRDGISAARMRLIRWAFAGLWAGPNLRASRV